MDNVKVGRRNRTIKRKSYSSKSYIKKKNAKSNYYSYKVARKAQRLQNSKDHGRINVGKPIPPTPPEKEEIIVIIKNDK